MRILLLMLMLSCCSCKMLRNEVDRHITKITEETFQQQVEVAIGKAAMKYWQYPALVTLATALGIIKKKNGKNGRKK